jgi:hypothetical protein
MGLTVVDAIGLGELFKLVYRLPGFVCRPVNTLGPKRPGCSHQVH